MRILYVLLSIVLVGTFGHALSTVRRRFRVPTPILGWIVGLSYFVLAPLIVLTLNGGFRFPEEYGLNGNWWEIDFSKPRFLFPYIVIWLSLMLTCAVVYLFGSAPGPKQGREYVISSSRLERVLRITIVFSVLDWILTIWLLGGMAEFLASHWYTRAMPLIDRYGSVYILYMRLSLVNQILFTSAAALYACESLRRRNTRWGFTSLIFLFLLIEVFMSGNRIFFALYLLAFLTSCWLYGRKKILATALVASPLIILVFSVWGSVRQNVSTISDSVDTYVINADMGNRAVTSLMDVTEGAAVMLLINITNDYGNKYEYLYGSTYGRLLTFFEPRILHPERTPDFQTITASTYEPGEVTTLGSTALGEAYANFGLFGIFVLPLFTWFALRYSDWLAAAQEKHTILSAVSFILFIWFARATFAETSMSLIGAALLIRVLRFEEGLCIPPPTEMTFVPAGSSPIFPLTPANPPA